MRAALETELFVKDTDIAPSDLGDPTWSLAERGAIIARIQLLISEQRSIDSHSPGGEEYRQELMAQLRGLAVLLWLNQVWDD